MPFEERIVNQRAEWWAEVTALSDTVPVIVRDGVVEIGFQGRRG
ncbi:MAG: hypothetical protein HYY02_04745 [Chloroflexi bacterium]|nr:hypothetical protein [Chloroflexota bacterium]